MGPRRDPRAPQTLPCSLLPHHHMPAAMSVARIARGTRVREVH